MKTNISPRVGIYVRVSTQDQSLDLQKHELTEFAKARGWTIQMFYEDKATGTNDKRPKLRELMAAAQTRQIDVVLVWKLDRFARSLKNLLSAIQDFQALGVDFVSMRDNIDLTTPSGRLMCHLLASFAEFEASLIKERVVAGLRAAKRKGVRLGRPHTIDVKRVIELRARGYSLAEIARRLKCSKTGVFKILNQTAS